MIGVVDTKEAIKQAEAAGLDLVEISPNSDPPVCKIADYDKLRYEAQKKRNEAKKKQKVVEIKEIKLRPVIDKNDYMVKMKAVNRFLDEGNKVKITLRFRGREMSHQDLAMDLMNRIQEDIKEKGKSETPPKSEGRQMIMILSPLSSK